MAIAKSEFGCAYSQKNTCNSHLQVFLFRLVALKISVQSFADIVYDYSCYDRNQ